MDSENYSDSTIIIPTLNEGKNINQLLNLINKLYPKINVIVSDDGSKDDTQKLVKEFSKINSKFKLLDRSNKKIKGLTASVIDGAKIVTTPYMITIDGDLQHPPEKIQEIIESLRKGAKVCVGTREKDLGDWDLYRQIMSKIAVGLGRLRLLMNGIHCKDPVSGFFGIKTDLIKKILLNNPHAYEGEGYKVLFDTLKNLPKSTKISNVYYFFGIRKTGQSKINKKHIMIYIKSLFK